MTAAACLGASIRSSAGRGPPVPLSCGDGEEAAPEDESSHLAGMTLPSGGMAAAEHVGELMAPLLVHHEKEAPCAHGVV